uniref:Uncharacterized protein n=1 Tax=Anopheles atroparvus TaxID=41427 RepID=A0AAG5D5F0_ANOAO
AVDIQPARTHRARPQRITRATGAGLHSFFWIFAPRKRSVRRLFSFSVIFSPKKKASQSSRKESGKFKFENVGAVNESRVWNSTGSKWTWTRLDRSIEKLWTECGLALR